MQEQPYAYYSNKILDLESGLKRLRKTISYLYLTRLITFLSFITFLVLHFQINTNYLFLIISISTLVLFLFVVKFNLALVYKKRFLANKLLVNKNELKFLKYNYHEHDTGIEYNYLNPHLAADFDLFGNGSFFQYLNRCSTKVGEKKFAESLCKSQLDEQVILNKQQAIKELSEKQDFLQDFQAYGKFINENGSELSNLQLWLDETASRLRLLGVLSILMPLLNAVFFTIAAFGFLSFNIVIASIFISLSIVLLNKSRINKAHSRLGKTAKIFKKYTTLIELIENEDFKTKHLSDLKQQLLLQDIKASQSLAALFKLLNNFDVRYNIIASFVLNSFMIFDVQTFYRIEKWKVKHKDNISSWFSVLSDIDALISYATFTYNNKESICYPKITDEDFAFKAEEIGHPLLPNSLRINNTVHFSGTPSVLVITGANMAGKSTFLRTISVNLILAMNGAPVCAKSFSFTPCDIMSSIKIQDSLSDNESYFYAELLRLKDILAHVETHPKTLVVFDEILRGTNTKDKQLGSLGLLEKLISQKAVVVIATHDLAIGKLENKYPDNVRNHCFEVELTNDQLIFDYKLKKGISQKLNASFLLKKMKIID